MQILKVIYNLNMKVMVMGHIVEKNKRKYLIMIFPFVCLEIKFNIFHFYKAK